MRVKGNRFYQSREASDRLRCPGTKKSGSGTKPQLREVDPNRSKPASSGHLGPLKFSLRQSEDTPGGLGLSTD